MIHPPCLCVSPQPTELFILPRDSEWCKVSEKHPTTHSPKYGDSAILFHRLSMKHQKNMSIFDTNHHLVSFCGCNKLPKHNGFLIWHLWRLEIWQWFSRNCVHSQGSRGEIASFRFPVSRCESYSLSNDPSWAIKPSTGQLGPFSRRHFCVWPLCFSLPYGKSLGPAG